MAVQLYCGPMFAGKTSELIRTARRFALAQVPVTILKPSIDTRFGAVAEVASHDESRYPCKSVGPGELAQYVREPVVLLDEVQFFIAEEVERFLTTRSSDQKTFAFGLDLDFRGKPWATTALVASLADSVVKLRAVCECCGADANRTQRKMPWGGQGQVQVGGAEAYSARCLDHWRDVA